jgi:hypothetical protein
VDLPPIPFTLVVVAAAVRLELDPFVADAPVPFVGIQRRPPFDRRPGRLSCELRPRLCRRGSLQLPFARRLGCPCCELRPRLCRRGDLQLSFARRPLPRALCLMAAVGCALVFVAEAASNFPLPADPCGVRSVVMAAKKTPHGSEC